jgi:hypothetical protein
MCNEVGIETLNVVGSEGGDENNTPEELLAMMISTVLTLGWLLLMARVFQEREHWESFHDAFYWAFITSTTIGFGDFSPELTQWWPSTHAYIVVSLVLMALWLGQAGNLFFKMVSCGWGKIPAHALHTPMHAIRNRLSHNTRRKAERHRSSVRKSRLLAFSEAFSDLEELADERLYCLVRRVSSSSLVRSWTILIATLMASGAILSALESSTARLESAKYWDAHREILDDFMVDISVESITNLTDAPVDSNSNLTDINAVEAAALAAVASLAQASNLQSSQNLLAKANLEKALDLLNAMGTCPAPPEKESEMDFTFKSAVLYAFYMASTIGYGDMNVRTFEGKVAVFPLALLLIWIFGWASSSLSAAVEEALAALAEAIPRWWARARRGECPCKPCSPWSCGSWSGSGKASGRKKMNGMGSVRPMEPVMDDTIIDSTGALKAKSNRGREEAADGATKKAPRHRPYTVHHTSFVVHGAGEMLCMLGMNDIMNDAKSDSESETKSEKMKTCEEADGSPNVSSLDDSMEGSSPMSFRQPWQQWVEDREVERRLEQELVRTAEENVVTEDTIKDLPVSFWTPRQQHKWPKEDGANGAGGGEGEVQPFHRAKAKAMLQSSHLNQSFHASRASVKVHEEARGNTTRLQVMLTVLASVGFVTLSTYVFVWVEGGEGGQQWSLFDTLWFFIITTTTIGFGDMSLDWNRESEAAFEVSGIRLVPVGFSECN